MKLVQTLPLSGVGGRIDHLSVDLRTQKLFIAALGNSTVEIVDLTQEVVDLDGKRVDKVLVRQLLETPDFPVT